MLTTAGLFAMATFAQVAPSTNKGGLKIVGGVNLANITIDDNGRVDESKQLTSFRVGAILDLPLGDALSLQPGLLYTGKGAKTQQGSESSASYYRATTNPMYVELPVNLVGKIPMTSTSNFFFGAGPYVAAGVGGKNKTEGKLFNAVFKKESDINFSNDNPLTGGEEDQGYGKLKRFDYGFNVLTGLDLGKFSVGANYGYGLAKINSGSSNRANDKNKHRVLSFTLGVKI